MRVAGVRGRRESGASHDCRSGVSTTAAEKTSCRCWGGGVRTRYLRHPNFFLPLQSEKPCVFDLSAGGEKRQGVGGAMLGRSIFSDADGLSGIAGIEASDRRHDDARSAGKSFAVVGPAGNYRLRRQGVFRCRRKPPLHPIRRRIGGTLRSPGGSA